MGQYLAGRKQLVQKFKKNGAASMTGINATCQLHFQVNWVKPFIVVLIITEHNRGQQVYSSQFL